MKNYILILLFSIFSVTCYSQTIYGKPEVNPTEIQKTYDSWQIYQKTEIMLSRDFVALNSDAKEISKSDFLEALKTGIYIPIKLKSDNSTIYYKLFIIEPTSDTSIKATITQIAFDEFENLKMEEKAFPKFEFKDLNGNVVSNETMKGKIIVIKCWYIHCAACIKEFPAVNALANKYIDRKDIIFLSLAEDSPDQLNKFLLKKPLSYLVVPNMKNYMNETLHLNAFPTHFIINKEGFIAKVLSNSESLEVALEMESRLN